MSYNGDEDDDDGSTHKCFVIIVPLFSFIK